MSKKIIINVGRQFGSGGKAVAEELGNRLGIKVYDKELIKIASKKSGFSESLFTFRDEKRRFWKISNIFGSNRYGEGSSQAGLNDGEIFKIMSDVIRDIACKESAIFVGRAANYILRDFDCCLNVFITAPMAFRRAKIAASEGISEEKAEEYIYRKDKARAEFYNFFTFGHWGKSVEYDLCIDASKLGPEKTADIIIDLAGKLGMIQ